MAYLFNTKFPAINMKKENSLPWELYPSLQISKGNRPNPDPGHKTLSSKSSIEYVL